MSRTLRLLLVWIVVSVTAFPLVTVAQDATPVAGDDTYVSPDGSFSVPIPTNWTVEEHDGYASLVDPDGDLRLSVLVVTAADAKAGIVDGWALVDPAFDTAATPVASQEIPSSPGIDETFVITYDDGSTDGSFAQGAGQRVGDRVYLIIISGSLDAIIKRSSQVQVIATGYTIEGMHVDDLSGVTPKRFGGAVQQQFVGYVDELRSYLDVPGASVAIVQDGKVVFADGFGVKELGGNDPVTADSLLMIGSVTKSMTTMMMGTEVDDGLLDWDEPVVNVLPEFAVADPDLTKTITVRNLVCACTGVPRRDLEFIFNADSLTAESVVESLQGFQFFTGFGEAFQYSNQMVATGGYVAAAAAGGTWGDLAPAYLDNIQSRVLDPIGMTDTTFSFDDVVASDDFAMPHGANLTPAYGPIPLSLEETLIPIAPAGGAWSSATDMAKYLITQIDRGVAPDGTRVVSEENLLETWTPQVDVDASTSYGLGWFLQDYNGLRLIQHGGNTFGFTSSLMFLPDAGIGIVVLANAQGANTFTDGVGIRLFELLYGQPKKHDGEIRSAIEESQQQAEGVLAGLKNVDEKTAAKITGTYSNATLGDVEVSWSGEALMFDAGEFDIKMVISPDAATADSFTLFAFDAPFAGTPVVVRGMQVGKRTFEIDIGTDTYVFDLVEGGATPVAEPIASPVAA